MSADRVQRVTESIQADPAFVIRRAILDFPSHGLDLDRVDHAQRLASAIVAALDPKAQAEY